MSTALLRPTAGIPAAAVRMRERYMSVIASAALFLVLFGSIIARYDFASPAQVFLNLLVDNAYLIVLAVGMTFVILTGGIDLSVGSVVALSTVILAKTLQAGLPTPVAIVLVLVVGPLLGLLMGSVIEFFDVQPFIVTLAGMFLARGLCYVISVDTLPIKDPALRALGLNYVYVYEDKFIRWTVVIALIVVVVAAYVLHQTRFGRTVYARRRQQAIGSADGPVHHPDPDLGVCDQRVLRSAGRAAARRAEAVRLQPQRRRVSNSTRSQRRSSAAYCSRAESVSCSAR